MISYSDFLKRKTHADDLHGFKPVWLPECMFPFQTFVGDWAIRKGRAAVLADCGLGKSIVELVWLSNVLRKTNKPVLLLAPLAVSSQFVREGEKFGIEVHLTKTGKIHRGINVTNYERLHYYDPKSFAAIALDESSILKNFAGKLRRQITDALHQVPYRLLATATPAPNDYMELGTSSEALGYMGRGQMLGMFFTNRGDDTQQWDLKGHARKRFWRWICSWARALRKPSDLGFNDEGFILPPMETRQHVVKTPHDGIGFGLRTAKTLDEQRKERRLTLTQRCEKVAELVPKDDYCAVWCHLNPEGDLLEKIIPSAVQVAGSDRDEVKEERLSAFANGQIKILVTKPKIGGWGLNLQHCNRTIMFASNSWEQCYQVKRRFWRFGQKRKVIEDIVTSVGESRVVANMKRKERLMEGMFESLVREMSEYQLGKREEERGEKVIIPQWLKNGHTMR